MRSIASLLSPASSRRDWPVFLIGCHRSGTTLARYLLDAHPRLACPPESKFIGGINAFVEYPQAMEALRHLGVREDEVLASFLLFTRNVLDGFARKQGKHRWIDKTPNYYRVLPLIDRMFKQQVLYLFMVRHPFDCISSLEEARYFNVPLDTQPDLDVARARRRYGQGREGWAHYWCEVNNRLDSFTRTAEDRCMFFRYEDLVQKPTAVLLQLCTFLAEDLPANLIPAAFRLAHTSGYQDWRIRQTHTIHTNSINRWTSWPSDEVARLWDIVDTVAPRFGYSPTATSATDPLPEAFRY